ncbi:hypothetical protein [Legionella feeleii]|uniref:Uncharacterized protein n=1 Tax=Legionella feeleii TaxID=453 RepID=A0A2X1QUQ4_9GAMM|nr:hypothetical protein [Legionella feeleii]SPX61987.1 Uncharacterised protein [Legionella feeleii]
MKESAFSDASIYAKRPALSGPNKRVALNRTGNWCGHSPDVPRFFREPDSHKPRPKILTWAMESLRRFYSKPSSFFPELRLTRFSKRRQRSESREAVASVAQVLLHYTELASLRVGVPNALGFRSLTVSFIAKKAGIGLKRAYRALSLLKRAGYLRLTERFDIKEGGRADEKRFIGLAAVKCLMPSFFKACGINLQALSAQRRLARKRLDRQKKQESNQVVKAPVIDIANLVGVKKNAKAHLGSLLTHLKEEERKQREQREQERKRIHSLLAAGEAPFEET